MSGNRAGVMCIISFYKHDLCLVLSASTFFCKASVKLKKAPQGGGNSKQNSNGDEVIRRTLSWKVFQ